MAQLCLSTRTVEDNFQPCCVRAGARLVATKAVASTETWTVHSALLLHHSIRERCGARFALAQRTPDPRMCAARLCAMHV